MKGNGLVFSIFASLYFCLHRLLPGNPLSELVLLIIFFFCNRYNSLPNIRLIKQLVEKNLHFLLMSHSLKTFYCNFQLPHWENCPPPRSSFNFNSTYNRSQNVRVLSNLVIRAFLSPQRIFLISQFYLSNSLAALPSLSVSTDKHQLPPFLTNSAAYFRFILFDNIKVGGNAFFVDTS